MDLDTGASAKLVCLKWLRHHNSLLAKFGYPAAAPYSAKANFTIRNWQVHHAAGVLVAIAGRRGMSNAFPVVADILALLRKGASEAMGGGLDVSRNCLRRRRLGADAPRRSNASGRYVLDVAYGVRSHAAARAYGNSAPGTTYDPSRDPICGLPG